ncbi:hypothetical protein H0H81_012001 [Sphagnurus paluster]|uniref:F-box protein n=1 Tax=Sphagnurus paluster TaxID=117069 RepID=A0A9P7FS18_9AGAR|nr:hypothetical protein H0H81_012001 [Sphagnurus paluster]
MPADLWILERRDSKRKQGSSQESSQRMVMKFTRPLNENDWQRFDYYGDMVRGLRLGWLARCSSDYIDLDPDIFGALDSYAHESRRLQPYLHKLVSVAFCLGRASLVESFPYIGCLLSSRHITTISIGRAKNPKSIKLDDIQALSSFIAQHCPNTAHLTISDLKRSTPRRGWYAPEPVLSISPLILGMHNLESIRCEPFELVPEVLHRLGQLPDLGRLETGILPQNIDMGMFAELRFSSLSQINLHAGGFGIPAKLLQSLKCKLISVSITLIHYQDSKDTETETSEAEGLEDLLAALTNGPHPSYTLTNLALVDERWGSKNAHHVPTSYFQRLFTLKGLRSLELALRDLGNLDDEWLHDAARSWPNIETLKISGDDTRFTLKGLVPLVEQCRELATLEIYPVAEPFDLSILLPGIRNTRIHGIVHLHTSKMIPENVFACLNAMFPNVTGVARADALFKRDLPEDLDSDSDEDAWERLEQLYEEKWLSTYIH